jgi:hypothetical protein
MYYSAQGMALYKRQEHTCLMSCIVHLLARLLAVFYVEHRIAYIMWRLKVSERSSPWLRSLNNLLGRQEWVFDPDLGTPEERAQVDKARREFAEHRFERKHSSDLLMRIQVCPMHVF